MRRKIVWMVLVAVLAGCGGKKKIADVAAEQQSDPGYNYRIGVLQLNQGNLPPAIQALQRCVALDPKNAEYWNALGLAYFMGRGYKDALGAFGKALEINPAYTEIHNNLGSIYSEMTLYDKAEAEYKKVLEDLTYPKPEAAYFNLALIAYIQKKNDQALNYCRLAISMNRAFARVYTLVGRISEDKNDIYDAIANYRVRLQIDPEGVELNYNIGLALYKTKQFDEARTHFEKVLQVNPTSDQGKNSIEYIERMKRSGS